MSVSIPDINIKKNLAVSFMDSTPSADKVPRQPAPDAGSGFLPQIGMNGSGQNSSGQGPFQRKKSYQSGPRRDFFKLHQHDSVVHEQNDQVIKQYVGKQLTKRQPKKQQFDDMKAVSGIVKGLTDKETTRNQQYASMMTDYDEFEPGQRIDRQRDLQNRAQSLLDFQRDIDYDFSKATQIVRQQRNSLFHTILDNSTAVVRVHSKQNVMEKKAASLRSRFLQLRQSFGKKGRTNSSLEVLAMLTPIDANKRELQDSDISGLYIPKDKRVFKKPAALAPRANKGETIKLRADLGQVLKQMQLQQMSQVTVARKKRKQPPKVVKKIKRRASFSEGQMKYDDVKLLRNPLRDRKGVSMKDAVTIQAMQQYRRYPVPEQLIWVPEKYSLFLDSIITQAYSQDEHDLRLNYKQELDVPNNSLLSEEEVDFASSSESATDMIPQPTSRKQKADQKKKKSKVNKASLKFHGFHMDLLKAYPHAVKDGDVPLHVLRPDLLEEVENFEAKIWPTMQAEWRKEDGKLFPTPDHVQLVFDAFCQEFQGQPVQLRQYFHKGVLSFRNQIVSINQVKALCCIMPYLEGLKHVKFESNTIQDEMLAVLLLAIFMNPDVNCLTIKHNFIKLTTANTYLLLYTTYKHKIHELNLQSSISDPNHLDKFLSEQILSAPALSIINVSNISMSMKAANTIGKLLVTTSHLKDLNVKNCKISYQGTRYVLDGIIRNTGLTYFNFNNNSMNSTEYEFSVKVGKILQRHQSLIHMDLGATGLKKEEILFIGMAMSTSKSALAVHLTANNLDYYERIFMRTLTGARVAWHFRNAAGAVNLKERAKVLELGDHRHDEDALRDFVKTWNYIDSQRLGLDDEINQIMKEVDLTAIFKSMRKSKDKQAQVDNSNLLQQLVKKIEQRKEELKNMKEEESEYNQSEESRGFNLDDAQTMTNFKEMFGVEDGRSPGKAPRDLKDGDDEGDDKFQMQNALKVARIKAKMDQEAERQKRAKSAGEMALKFMGINKIAYELLLENPMTGYMNDVIFSRILGNEDIYKGAEWRDSSQCWICERWARLAVQYYDNDHKMMQQSVSKIEDLHQVLKQVVNLGVEKLVRKLPQSKVNRMYRSGEGGEFFGGDMLGDEDKKDEEEESVETLFSDKFYTESLPSSLGDVKPDEEFDLDVGNTISPIKLDKYRMSKQLPRKHNIPKDLEPSSTLDQYDISEDSDLEDMKESQRVKTPEPRKRTTHSDLNKTPIGDSSSQKLGKDNENDDIIKEVGFDEELSENDPKLGETFVTRTNSNENAARESPRVAEEGTPKDKEEGDGKTPGAGTGTRTPAETFYPAREFVGAAIPEKKKTRIVKRTIFYKGTAFMIEEEISIDSDEETSVHTSEDSFEVKSDAVRKGYAERVDERVKERTEEQRDRVEKLQRHLDKNRPDKDFNEFGRKQVYFVASFNDWLPVEMRTQFEIKTIKKNVGLFELENLLAKMKVDLNGAQYKSKKKDENAVRYVHFVPPGRHYFYFVFQNKYLFLSPRYDIVRFKGTQLFLNQIVTEPRVDAIKTVTLNRTYATNEGLRFIKDRSVWKTFEEDTPEACEAMLTQDLTYSKIHKLMRTAEDQKALKAVVLKYYLQVKNIFLMVAANSSYPTIGLNDFTEFVRTSKLFDKNINLATVDRKFINTNQSTHKYKVSAERELHRYEFVEVLVRLAQEKYQLPKIVETLPQAIEKMLVEDVLPRNNAVDGLNFRNEHMYNLKVDEVFKKNEQVIRKLYESFTNPAKKYIQLEECQKLLQKANLNINDYKVSPCYVESMMSKVDTMKDLSVLQQMKYVEFTVFIARVSHEAYKASKNEDWPLHIKVDKCLVPLLDYLDLKKMFNVPDAESDHSDGSGSGDDDDDDESGEAEQDDRQEAENQEFATAKSAKKKAEKEKAQERQEGEQKQEGDQKQEDG